MHKTLTIAAALSALAMPALAAPNETPYALAAVHADFQAQLDEIGGRPDEIGAAARAAAGLMAPHNAAQERLVLPLLGWADSAAAQAEPAVDLPDRVSLEAEISQLYADDVDVVTALVELYAVADAAGDAETLRRAERMIWHETGDIEVYYPAALLVASAIRAQAFSVDPAAVRIAPQAPGGAPAAPMTGAGTPQGPGTGN